MSCTNVLRTRVGASREHVLLPVCQNCTHHVFHVFLVGAVGVSEHRSNSTTSFLRHFSHLFFTLSAFLIAISLFLLWLSTPNSLLLICLSLLYIIFSYLFLTVGWVTQHVISYSLHVTCYMLHWPAWLTPRSYKTLFSLTPLSSVDVQKENTRHCGSTSSQPVVWSEGVALCWKWWGHKVKVNTII